LLKKGPAAEMRVETVITTAVTRREKEWRCRLEVDKRVMGVSNINFQQTLQIRVVKSCVVWDRVKTGVNRD
jgi:hypothetical protein